MRNAMLQALDGLVGEWTLTMSDAWFLEPPGTEVHGSATVEWFGDAFLLVHSTLQGEMSLAIGRSDADDAYQVLYHDHRGVCRLFAMTWDGSPSGARGSDLEGSMTDLERCPDLVRLDTATTEGHGPQR